MTFTRLFYHWLVKRSIYEDYVLEAAEQRERERVLDQRLPSVFIHVKKEVERLRKQEMKLAVQLQQLNRLSTNVTGAYIVFNNEHTRTCVLDDYRTSTGWLARTLQPHPLRFCDIDGRCYPLKITPAPPPDAIIWENVVDATRFWPALRLMTRKLSGLVVLIMAAVVPIALLAMAAHERTFLQQLSDDGGVCDQLPASFYGTARVLSSTPSPPSLRRPSFAALPSSYPPYPQALTSFPRAWDMRTLK
jgi:hypothetical protein